MNKSLKRHPALTTTQNPFSSAYTAFSIHALRFYPWWLQLCSPQFLQSHIFLYTGSRHRLAQSQFKFFNRPSANVGVMTSLNTRLKTRPILRHSWRQQQQLVRTQISGLTLWSTVFLGTVRKVPLISAGSLATSIQGSSVLGAAAHRFRSMSVGRSRLISSSGLQWAVSSASNSALFLHYVRAKGGLSRIRLLVTDVNSRLTRPYSASPTSSPAPFLFLGIKRPYIADKTCPTSLSYFNFAKDQCRWVSKSLGSSTRTPLSGTNTLNTYLEGSQDRLRRPIRRLFSSSRFVPMHLETFSLFTPVSNCNGVLEFLPSTSVRSKMSGPFAKGQEHTIRARRKPLLFGKPTPSNLKPTVHWARAALSRPSLKLGTTGRFAPLSRRLTSLFSRVNFHGNWSLSFTKSVAGRGVTALPVLNLGSSQRNSAHTAPTFFLSSTDLNSDLPPLSLTSFITENLFYFTPSISSLFVRTPFFVITHTLDFRPSSFVDDSRTMQNPLSRYLIFPQANDVKSFIFRRLNKQRQLFSTRYARFCNLKSNVGSPELSLPVRHGADSDHTVGKYITSTPISHLQGNNSVWSLFSASRKGTTITPRVKRIRFKPGYSRLWRLARTSVRELLDLPIKYQYRLTPKLQSRFFQSRALKADENVTTLELLLIASRLLTDRWAVNEAFNHEYVYLNGCLCTNSETRLFRNDFVQLVISIKSYALLKWLQNFFITKQTKTNKVFYRKFRPSPFNKNIRIVRPLPSWFFDLQAAYADVPKYIEVDYFTLSFFVLYDNLKFSSWSSYRFRYHDNEILNMYNWKYIT